MGRAGDAGYTAQIVARVRSASRSRCFDGCGRPPVDTPWGHAGEAQWTTATGGAPDIFRGKTRYSAHRKHDTSRHGPAICGGAGIDCRDYREESEEAVYCRWGKQELSVESPDGGEDRAGGIAWLAGVDDFGQFRHPDGGVAGKLE